MQNGLNCPLGFGYELPIHSQTRGMLMQVGDVPTSPIFFCILSGYLYSIGNHLGEGFLLTTSTINNHIRINNFIRGANSLAYYLEFFPH